MKKRFPQKPILNLSLNGWLIAESVFIVCGSVCTYALLDFIYHSFFPDNSYRPIVAIGMFLPMSVLIGFIVYAFSRAFYQYVSEVLNAITEISAGNFQIRLDETAGGPLKDIYHKFNLMGEELASIDAMRNDFVNEFSHEFKTPLSSIHGFSQLLLKGDCTAGEAQKYLSIIAKESERLTALTQSQLLLSRLDSQQIVTGKRSYLLDEQIRQCIILLSSEWQKKNLSLSIELDPINFYGNYELLQHVWINLISNAVKYTPDGGEISVFSISAAHEICIQISDTGIGMDEGEISHIFARYYRAGNSADLKGLGLGLPIVKRIVEMHNGSVEVESEVGAGSTFTVILPVAFH